MKKTALALAIAFGLTATPYMFAAPQSTTGKTSNSTAKKHKRTKKGSSTTKGGGGSTSK